MALEESVGSSSRSLDDPFITEAEDFRKRKVDINTTALIQKLEKISGYLGRKKMGVTSCMGESLR